jgi:hypothetical protein
MTGAIGCVGALASAVEMILVGELTSSVLAIDCIAGGLLPAALISLAIPLEAPSPEIDWSRFEDDFRAYALEHSDA